MAKKKITHVDDDAFDDPKPGAELAALLKTEKAPSYTPSAADIEAALASYRDEEPDALTRAELELREIVALDPQALEKEFVEIGSQIAFVGARHARAIRGHLQSKARAKRLRGLLLLRARESILDRGGKPTESQVEAIADQYAEWVEAQTEEIEAEVAREQAKGFIAAAVAKKDMLVQLGANFRQEGERDPSIIDQRRAGRRS